MCSHAFAHHSNKFASMSFGRSGSTIQSKLKWAHRLALALPPAGATLAGAGLHTLKPNLAPSR